MIIRQFYEKLGTFLYILALSDGAIQEKEELVLMQEIIAILDENPGFEKNAEVHDLLLTKLHYLNARKSLHSSGEFTKDYLHFLKVNINHISPQSKSIASRLIRKVTTAYKGINKQEQKLMKEIVGLLSGHKRIELNEQEDL